MTHLLGNLFQVARLPALGLRKGRRFRLVAEQDVHIWQRVEQRLLEGRNLLEKAEG